MITLAIETSTPLGGVAVCASGELIFEESFTADRSHSAALFLALEKARRAAPQIEQVAIGLGPGSYAGVRIAIAGAIGLQLGLRILLVGLPSVAALQTEAREYLAIGDARRETFYFTHVVDGICTSGPLLLAEADLRQLLSQSLHLPVFTSAALPGFPGAELATPSAAVLARLAASGRGITAHDDLEPIYLREPHITAPKTR
jgi:tRNA threonylcarbamoyladenosine biosynthesis protein TsaB